MPSLNKTLIMGNLGSDPEMRYTANGKATTSFRVAVNERYGEGKESTEWFSVVTWDKLAEVCGQHLAKGSAVFVEGRMKTRSWDASDGKKQYRTELIAQTVQFLDRRESVHPGNDIDADDLPFDD